MPLLQSVPAVLSGDIPVVVAGPASLLPHARAGKVRMIAAVNPRQRHNCGQLVRISRAKAD
jgi:tripartite-type tricarboxylate transporter receptor subunit TctC